MIIYTVCYNTPDFIELQYKLLLKFISDTFTYVVYNNTMTDGNITNQNNINNGLLQDTCTKFNIPYYDIPAHIFKQPDPSIRAGIAIDYAIAHIHSHYNNDELFILIDSDLFPISPINIPDIMVNKYISGRLQFRKTNTNSTIYYITNHIVMYNPITFKNTFKHFSFMPGEINGAICDCGGNIHHILKNIKECSFINWTNILFSDKGTYIQNLGGSPDKESEFNRAIINTFSSDLKKYIMNDTFILNRQFPFCEILSSDRTTPMFLHLRAGTNWINYDISSRKQLLYKYINTLLAIDTE